MPVRIEVQRLRELLAQGAQLVEVLPVEEFRGEHLTAAQNIPLKGLSAETTGGLRRSSPVVVYCHDAL